MAATNDEAMEYLLGDFDQIYQGFRNGVTQIQTLQLNCDAEMKKREAVECSVHNLKSENERLVKLYTESLNKLAVQLEHRINYQSLKEELKRVNDGFVSKETENKIAMESLKQDYTTRIKDLDTQIRGFLLEKQANEATISQLHEDLAAHRNHIEVLKKKLEQVHSDVEFKYHHEIQDLKDCLLVEQEERNALSQKLQDLEKELFTSRMKLLENQRDLTSNRHVETLKQKIMKLRKENEILKRQLNDLKAG